MTAKANEHIASILSSLPEEPGCYQYVDEAGVILYIGKAKNLKKRVGSYFHKTHDTPKLRVLVRKIRDIKYIVVNNEEDALLLENSLIKEHQPRYNAELKDDKTYPSIVVRNELLPRVYATRHIVNDGSLYFGPYSSVAAMKAILSAIRSIYPIRTCRHPFTPEAIRDKKFPVCLQYHIKTCKGPCQGYQSEEDYRKDIEEIKEILGGNIARISRRIKEEMRAYAQELQFEKAQELKEKYELIERYKKKSEIVNPKLHDIDVFSYDETEQSAYINFLHVSAGSIVRGYTIEYKKRLEEPKEEIFSLGIIELRKRFGSQAKEIVAPFVPEMQPAGVRFTVPLRGDKKTLLDLSLQNVRQYKLDQLKRNEKLNPEQRGMQLMKEVQEKLQLPKPPLTIDCFDNSNIQGSSAVAACVVYKNGKPSKKDYRKYIIKTVEGPDDYASMREIAYRRYARMIQEEAPLPDLVVADGGVGQMEAIRQVIEEVLGLAIPILGLAKNNKHRTNELLIGFPPKAVSLMPAERAFHFFAGMQEEVHRFAIKFHRETRSKQQTASALDAVKGIGEETQKELIRHFKSLKRVKSAPFEELKKVIGTHRASIIYAHFNPDSTR